MKKRYEEISIISSYLFVYGKMTAEKHGYKSVPDSIAGLWGSADSIIVCFYS